MPPLVQSSPMTESNRAWRETIGSRLHIGEFEVDASANELHRDGVSVRLRPLLMDVLLRLATSPGAVVTRELLIDDVWPRRMVNDEVLSRAIAELRTVLADDAKQPRYIETLPKIGYRLIAAVARPGATAPEQAAVADPEERHPIGSPTAGAAAVNPAGSLTGDAAAGKEVGPVKPAGMWRRQGRWFRFGIAGGILLAGATALVGTREQATPARLSLQIAAAQSFSSDADLELAPRFSPDGSNVIYAQGTVRETHLVIRDLRGNVVTTIEKPDAILLSPLFGPWSRRIYYWQRTAEGCAIIERDLASAVERQIIGCDNQPQPRFDLTADGVYLAVTMRPRPEHPPGIARVRVSDGMSEMLTTPQPGEGEDGLPRFSPDGSQVAFARGSASHAKLWIVDTALPAAAIKARPLASVEGLLYGVAWLGDKGPLIAAADWPGFRALHRVDIATGEAELVGARGARFPDVSSSGDLVFELATYRADLWLTDANDPGTSPKIQWPSSRYSNQPEFSPDGKRVAFVSNREGAEALFIGTIGGEARKLVDATEHRFIRAHWSPDGTAIYAVRSPVSSRQSGPREAVKLMVGDGRIEVLKSLGSDVNDVRELPDGSFLVAENAGTAMRLVRVSKGIASRLALPLVSQLQTWGDDLVFIQPDLNTVTHCVMATMHCRPLPVTIDENDTYHWHLGNGILWYRARPDGGPAKLMKLDLRNGSVRAFDFPPTGTGTALASSPDGRWLMVTREAPLTIDLMLAKK